MLDRYGVDMKIGITQERNLKVGMEDFAFDEDEGGRSTNTGGGGGWGILEVSSDGSYVDLTPPHTRNLLGPNFCTDSFMI